jgi:hypothetical protein
VTAFNYSTIASLHTLQISIAVCCVFTSRFLVKTSNSGETLQLPRSLRCPLSLNCTHYFLFRLPSNSLQLGWYPRYNPLARTALKTLFLIFVVQLFPWAHLSLRRHRPVTAVTLIKNLLPSSGCCFVIVVYTLQYTYTYMGEGI